MSFEAIKGISDAETLGKAKVAEAEAKVKQMLADAEESGKAALDAANSRAETELKALREKADQQAADPPLAAFVLPFPFFQLPADQQAADPPQTTPDFLFPLIQPGFGFRCGDPGGSFSGSTMLIRSRHLPVRFPLLPLRQNLHIDPAAASVYHVLKF